MESTTNIVIFRRLRLKTVIFAYVFPWNITTTRGIPCKLGYSPISSYHMVWSKVISYHVTRGNSILPSKKQAKPVQKNTSPHLKNTLSVHIIYHNFPPPQNQINKYLVNIIICSVSYFCRPALNLQIKS